MAMSDNRTPHDNHTPPEGRTPRIEPVRDPQALSMIERIFYYEHFTPAEAAIAADNDNARAAQRLQASGSACFDEWAKPDYLRR
jgi:hypothetical protein